MSACTHIKPIYSASVIIHSESASGRDASTDSTTEVDPVNSAPNDFVPQQQGMDEETQNKSYDHLSTGTDLNVLVDKTQSVSEGLETVLTKSNKGKGANTISQQIEEASSYEASQTIRLEDLSKLVHNVKADFMDLDSPEDDPIIVVDESEEDDEEDKDEKIHATSNIESGDTSVPKPPSPRQDEAEVALFSAKPSFPDLPQLNELLVKSLHSEFSKILSAHNFSSSLPTELKDLSSNVVDTNGIGKQAFYVKFSCEGYLEDAAEINNMDYAYFTPFASMFQR
ncbi:hypothetical protein Tco_0200236 [Tanacetum coccineum]|uniref:Uncharacterized protein n=1 Tax=Tanacetum coccineum TaxID=301880 RepID=A0ABQ5H876_9ASTR